MRCLPSKLLENTTILLTNAGVIVLDLDHGLQFLFLVLNSVVLVLVLVAARRT